jgi:hypothetical protein
MPDDLNETTESGSTALPAAPEFQGLLQQAKSLDAEVVANSPDALAAAEEHEQALTLAQSNAAGVVAIFDIALPLIFPMFPSLEQVYTADAQKAIAMSMGPLLAKHNIDLKEAGGKYKEELVAVMVCGPVALATYKGIKADIAERAGAPKALEHAPAGAALAPPKAGALKPGDYGYVESQVAA